MSDIDTAETPLMKQYAFLKKKHRDSILFFRLGDFYEMFNEDAKLASSILSITLTSRQGVPMCGVPHHSASGYISKLISANLSVAVCEQVAAEEDKKTKLFKREVVRVITPGTVIEEDLLENKSSNYLIAVCADLIGWSLSYCDISTGEFKATENLNDSGFYCLKDILARLSPSEIVASSDTMEKLKKEGLKFSAPVSIHESDYSDSELSFKHPWRNHRLALKAAALNYSYILKTQPSSKFIFNPSYIEDDGVMRLDETAIKTLEITEPSYEGGLSLWKILDYSATSMGSRMIKRWALNPLTDIYSIKSRQDIVAHLFSNDTDKTELHALLKDIPDIERIIGRIYGFSLSPRDAVALKKAVKILPRLKILISKPGFFDCAGELSNRLNAVLGLMELKDLIDSAVEEEPPVKISCEKETIKYGYNKELDELRDIRKNSQSVIAQMEAREREKTAIGSLKIGYTSNFGYFIEITKTHLAKVPADYQRKQTLTNAERYTTAQLKELEDKLLGAEEKILKLENIIFNHLREKIYERIYDIREFAVCLAELDAFFSLAECAYKNDYSRPEVSNMDLIEIEEGRHPAVERYLMSKEFVPNDFNSGGVYGKMIILTGPNMSGKSVYLRQNALCVIMAQMGSFVPAKKAQIGVVDRIMTRIGAHDRLSRGESTFMVEMKETAEILKLATSKSLILLDEIGRGTSTFDGISIAGAIAENLYKNGQGPKVIFATHYFELTDLALRFDGIKNFSVSVKEWTSSNGKKEVIFMHKIVPGCADKSYGIHVAQLAGLPEECIDRAKDILKELQAKTIPFSKEKSQDGSQELLPLFSGDPLKDKIRSFDLNRMTPLDAINAINELKESLD